MTIASTPIEYFKRESKKLYKLFKANNTEAIERVSRVLKNSADISLMRIQHVVAVEYGFLKWESLIKATSDELNAAISKKKESLLKDVSKNLITENADENRFKLRAPRPGETPLVSFLRGTGILPTPPHLAELADMFDKMTMKEQERWLDEDARRMGVFRR